MRTTPKFHDAARASLYGAWLLLAISGCGSDFTPPSELRSVRVLAVQKHAVGEDSAAPWSAAEGAELELTMLAHDGRAERDSDVQQLWFSGCANPRGDAYYACFGALAVMGLLLERCQEALGPLPWTLEPAADPLQASRIAECAPELATLLQRAGDAASAGETDAFRAGSLKLGAGSRFPFEVPEGTVLERDGTDDYGVSHVFFTACAGHVGLVEEYRRAFDAGELPTGSLVFPLACYDDAGEPRGVEDFVAGYTSVYTYADEASNANANPPIEGALVDGVKQRVEQGCDGASCPSGSKVCVGLDCVVETSCDSVDGCPLEDPTLPPNGGEELDCGDFAACVPTCTRRSSDDCPKYSFRPLLEKSALLAGPRATDGQLWIRYYASKGTLGRDPVRLYDANTGWNSQYGTHFTAPQEPGPFYVWAAVHDSRGGVNWVRASVLAR